MRLAWAIFALSLAFNLRASRIMLFNNEELSDTEIANLVILRSDDRSGVDGTTGLIVRTEGAGYYSFFPGRAGFGTVTPSTLFEMRGVPEFNKGMIALFAPAFTGSTLVGPAIYAHVDQQMAWKIGMEDDVSGVENNLRVTALGGSIRGFTDRGIQFQTTSGGLTSPKWQIHHTGFLGSLGDGQIMATDGNLSLGADTNNLGAGGAVIITSQPGKSIYLEGGVRHKLISSAGTYQIIASDSFIYSTATSTKTLPDASDVAAGFVLTVKSNGDATTTVNAASGDRIEGLTFDTLLPNQAAQYISDGATNWIKFSSHTPL